jgi:hypothetical protein
MLIKLDSQLQKPLKAIELIYPYNYISLELISVPKCVLATGSIEEQKN